MLVRKPERKRELGRPTDISDDNIKIRLEKYGMRSWTGLIWFIIGPVVSMKTVMNLRAQ
jgi:hypothetical protein